MSCNAEGNPGRQLLQDSLRSTVGCQTYGHTSTSFPARHSIYTSRMENTTKIPSYAIAMDSLLRQKKNTRPIPHTPSYAPAHNDSPNVRKRYSSHTETCRLLRVHAMRTRWNFYSEIAAVQNERPAAQNTTPDRYNVMQTRLEKATAAQKRQMLATHRQLSQK